MPGSAGKEGRHWRGLAMTDKENVEEFEGVRVAFRRRI